MNLLGLDYGDKHIGVAVATTFVAEALEVIHTNQAFEKIQSYITTYHLDGIVLGLSENQTAIKTKAFAAELDKKFHLPVYFHDETLTSQDTRRQMAQAGVKRSIRQAKTDHFVAAAILQDYLDSVTIN